MGANNVSPVWSPEEDARILGYVERGVAFYSIPASDFPGRTNKAVRSHASILSKRIAPKGADVTAPSITDIGMRQNAERGSRAFLLALVAYARKHHKGSDLAGLEIA